VTVLSLNGFRTMLSVAGGRCLTRAANGRQPVVVIGMRRKGGECWRGCRLERRPWGLAEKKQ
jgi:hypothetical protein